MNTVVIAGVGLIGGSFALALRRAGFRGRILGVSSPQTVAKASAMGIIDGSAPLEEAAAEADLVYLAQPISVILETLPRLKGCLRPSTLVTDAGSTKRAIVEAALRHLAPDQFLGGHPMAGKELRGVEAAEATLFEGRTYILTPAPGQSLETEPAAQFRWWVERIGSRLSLMSPEEHDATVAATSHLPQLLSTCLAAELETLLDKPAKLAAGGPGLQSMTRLAGSSFAIWRDILETNRDQIEARLASFAGRLEALLERLRQDPGTLEAEFAAGAKLVERLKPTTAGRRPEP